LEVVAAQPLASSPAAGSSCVSCYTQAYPGYHPRDHELLPDHLQAAKAALLFVSSSSSYPLFKNETLGLNFDHGLHNVLTKTTFKHHIFLALTSFKSYNTV
jgi:hypothetical protein